MYSNVLEHVDSGLELEHYVLATPILLKKDESKIRGDVGEYTREWESGEDDWTGPTIGDYHRPWSIDPTIKVKEFAVQDYLVNSGDYKTAGSTDAWTSTYKSIDLNTHLGNVDAEHEQDDLSEQDIADLTRAFQAVDTDGEGTIDATEFVIMVKVMGGDIIEEQAEGIIAEAKSRFQAFLALQDQKNIALCNEIWEEFDGDKSNTMDMGEINTMIEHMQNQGVELDPFPEQDIEAAGGEIDFDQFLKWFLTQEDVHRFHGSIEGGTLLNARKSKNPLKRRRQRKVAKKSKSVDRAALNVPGLCFVEFVYMLKNEMLANYLTGTNWRKSVDALIKLREVFDSSDVDGDNLLELDELEFVVLSTNPGSNITPAVIEKLWAALNPAGKEAIQFSDFARGMLTIAEDDELESVMALDRPNRFQLLSLVIDAPTNKDLEGVLLGRMSGAEKAGVKVLKGLKTKKQNSEQIQSTVSAGCRGQLHYLQPGQTKRVNMLHYVCVLQALAIGLATTFFPGLLENHLVRTYETDGAVDAYWACPATDHDPDAPPSTMQPPYHNLSLSACAFGLCTSVPANITEYLEAGGNEAMGGTWTNERPLIDACTIDDYATCPQQSCVASEWKPCTEAIELRCSPLPKTPLALDRLGMFWIFNVIGIVIGIVFELNLLIFVAIRSSVRVADSIDLRLVPLNEDRAFVANMLVRAAFEMGDPQGELMGINTDVDERDEPGVIRAALIALWFKGKVIITGIALKALTAKLVSYDLATFLKPFAGTMAATALWDAMTCHCIMKDAELRAIGVTTSVEVFNEIMDRFLPMYEGNPTTLPQIARIQILRAIGVAIAKHGSMFPTMEILLRHALNYLGMKRNKQLFAGGVLDNKEGFIKDFKFISLQECRAVLAVHMLSYSLTGGIRVDELQLWKTLLDRVEKLYQTDRNKFLSPHFLFSNTQSMSPPQLRKYMLQYAPNFERLLSLIPIGAPTEKKVLTETMLMPAHATMFSETIPFYVCQRFRNMESLTVDMIVACFDPEESMKFRQQFFSLFQTIQFVWNEITFKTMRVLVKGELPY